MANHFRNPWQPQSPPPRPNMFAQPREPSSSGVSVRASMDTQTIAPTLGGIGIENRIPIGSIVHYPPPFSHDRAAIRPDNMPLPHDACNCLYVTGLPEDCSKREIAHIFRPFKGYIRVKLAWKSSEIVDVEPISLCFVHFENSSYAAAAMMALQGYRIDEDDPESEFLEIKFAFYPAPI